VTSTFADLGVPAALSARLARRGIAEPFPIQAATLPDALAGRDVCGRAPTGSGEIRALLPPPAQNESSDPRDRAMNSRNGRKGRKGGKARQQAAETVLPIYGGAGYGPQRRGLARGAAVVVACPGRLEDLVEQDDVRLDDVDLVVVDEADRMADMGFLPAVRRLLDRTNPARQTLLFSATLDGDVDTLVRHYQRDPVRHETVLDEADAGEVEHRFWRTDRPRRVELAADLVDRHGRAIVFSRTRHGADRLARQLTKFGVTATAIHGDRSQGQRERALSAFAKGKVSALVATDVAARGIHVDDVACVIHYDLPADPKDYIHRSGRTGRAGASGLVVSFVLAEDRRSARSLQRALGFPEELDTPDVVTGRSAPRPVPSPGASPGRSTGTASPDDTEPSADRGRSTTDAPSRDRDPGRRGRGDASAEQRRKARRRGASGPSRRPARQGGASRGAKPTGGSPGADRRPARHGSAAGADKPTGASATTGRRSARQGRVGGSANGAGGPRSASGRGKPRRQGAAKAGGGPSRRRGPQRSWS
jgi:superfamily II DNA/RNA helicase